MSGDRQPHIHLSEAERRVLELLCEGLTNPEIGARLFLSRRTVQSHLYNMFKKVGVKSRTELATFALRAGLAADHPEQHRPQPPDGTAPRERP